MLTKMLTLLAPYVPVFQTALWVILIVIAAICFHKQCRQILEAIRRRIESGSSLKAGPVELGEDLRSLEYKSPGDVTEASDANQDDWAEERTKLYQNNKGIFLAHVITPSKTPGQKFDIFIYLIRHKTTDFTDVDRAEFFFGHMWGNRVYEETERKGMIGVSTSAYGPFLCTCRVYFKDGTEIRLNRYIDFEMERVFQ